MRYLFKSTYTPNNPDSDRCRVGTVVLSETGVLDAIASALSSLEMSELHDYAIGEYLDQSKEDDTSEGFTWVVGTNNGEYHFEIEPFEPSDPVTQESILEWAKNQAQEVEPGNATQEILYCICGRWLWRSLEWQDVGDLRESLYELIVTGPAQTPYCDLTIRQLLQIIMEEIVGSLENNYDEIEKGKPFGMTAMLEDDRALWYGED